ncbi:UNVERIFIED_CONTAM: hypothetical protein K2H54_001755 [Gekko kuhli]
MCRRSADAGGHADVLTLPLTSTPSSAVSRHCCAAYHLTHRKNGKIHFWVPAVQKVHGGWILVLDPLPDSCLPKMDNPNNTPSNFFKGETKDIVFFS